MRYDFQVTAGFNGARGTMTVLADGAVQMEGKTVSAVKLPADAQWLAAPILHRTSGKLEGDAYPSAEGTDNSSIYYVPDAVKSAYIYCPAGRDLPKTGGSYNTDSVSWAGLYRNTAGAEIEKVGAPWASINAVLEGKAGAVGIFRRKGIVRQGTAAQVGDRKAQRLFLRVQNGLIGLHFLLQR